MQRTRWWLTASLVLATAAAVLPFVTRAMAGPPGAVVNIRWQPSIDQAARTQLESRFRLSDGTRIDESTWRYDLLDTSDDNIRALVGEPAIADTHGIDRPAFRIDPAAERTSRTQRFRYGQLAVSALDVTAIVFALGAAILLVFGISGYAQTPAAIPAALGRMRSATSSTAWTALEPLARALSRGIPVIDARTCGAFRILFGLLAMVFLAARPVSTSRLANLFSANIQDDLHAGVMQWLSSHPGTTDAVMPWLFVTGAAFVAGVYTRVSYALFVGGLIVWAFAAVAFDSTHPHSTFVLAAVALLPSRWGDALSVDARLGRTSQMAPSKRYGYSVWIPGLVFGVAFAAAAWAKLAPNGLAWILNGSVKYHFVSDSANAAVDWGLQLAAHPGMAVIASLAAVAIEILVITAAFRRSEPYRLAMGLAAAALLGGFRLFMGVFWPGWWILLLGFLPWERLSVNVGRPQAALAARGAISAAQAVAVLAVVLQQVVMSAAAIERAPMFTNYPMYSDTYASPAAYNASRPPVFRIVAVRGTERIPLSCNPDEDLVDEFRAAVDGSAAAAARVWRAVLGCRPDLRDANSVAFEQSSRRFDWAALRFAESGPTVIGTLAAPALGAR